MAWWDHDDLRDVRYKRGDREMNTMSYNVKSANERQVGGSHYETGGVQHWDLFGPEYLMGYATKYLRWRKKGGIEDLEKAIHVIEKLIEVSGTRAKPIINQKMAEEWVTGYGLDWVERSIANRILFYRDHGDLREAIEGIRHLIATHESQPASNVIVVDHRIDLRPKSKSYSDMTDDELLAEKKRLVDANAEATGWGAAVGARSEDIREIKGVLARRLLDTQRTPEDGAQHASLSPWVVKDGWFTLDGNKNITMELKNTFFRERTKNLFVLEPYVEGDRMPRQLVSCYDLSHDLKNWILRIGNCPADAREYYPSLQRECNIVELGEKPLWQRAMYEWIDAENKHVLMPQFAAWHAEVE